MKIAMNVLAILCVLPALPALAQTQPQYVTLPPERPERGLFLAGFARTLQAQKRYAEAADAFGQARTNLVAAYGPTHARVVNLDQMRVALYREWGRPMPSQ